MKEFSCQVRRHDRNHIELKTNLPIPKRGKGKYDLSFYFFSPAQLHFNKDTIPRDNILRHIQTYTRFSSPNLPLAAFVDPSCELSPLKRINGFLNASQRGEEIPQDKIIYELQTLVNAFRGEFRGFADLLEQVASEQRRLLVQYRSRINSSITQIERILAELRELFPSFLDQRISDQTRTALLWADEALGIIALRNSVRLHALCDTEPALKKEKGPIEAFVLGENTYRLEQGYKTAFVPGDDHFGETLAYRESMLKKWAQSAMYMKSKDSKTPKNIGHILAGTAAATAMSFAVLAAVYAERIFVKNTTGWALIIILSYVFKDRIKEILRELFGRLLPRLLADRMYRLIDPATGKDAARSQVLINFLTDRDVPSPIAQKRDVGHNPFSAILPPQNVFHFNRLISLKGKLLRSNHSRLEAITEITRLRIDDYLKEMDEEKEILYKIEDSKRIRVSGKRVYHIHLVVSLREDRKGALPELFHYCIVLNRSGIIRIEDR